MCEDGIAKEVSVQYLSRVWWGRGEDTVLVFVKDIERFYATHCEFCCCDRGWDMQDGQTHRHSTYIRIDNGRSGSYSNKLISAASTSRLVSRGESCLGKVHRGECRSPVIYCITVKRTVARHWSINTRFEAPIVLPLVVSSCRKIRSRQSQQIVPDSPSWSGKKVSPML